jgi:RHS repeat-associated protein
MQPTYNTYTPTDRDVFQYTPYGSAMVSYSNAEYSYSFGYVGMYLDDDLKGIGNSYNTYWRMYDSRLSRWLSCDPLQHDARLIGQSPYSQALNNPIKYVDEEGDIPWDKVVAYTRVTSQQGNRIHPIHKTEKYHGGLDLGTKNGSDVRSMAGGKIVKIGWDPKGYGRYVVVEHPNGYYSLYAHLEKNSVKKKNGESVNDGEIIGKSGNTGGSTGPHLHLEVIKSDNLSGVFKKENKLDPQSLGDLEQLVNPNAKSNKQITLIDYRERLGLNTVQSDNTRLVLNISLPSSINYNENNSNPVSYSITASALNLREGAGVDNNAIGMPLPKGSVVIATGNSNGNWAEVRTDDGRTGWIHTGYTQKNNSQ